MIRLIATEKKPTIKWIEFYNLENGKVKHRYYNGQSFGTKIYSKSESAKIFHNFYKEDYYELDLSGKVIPGPGL